MLEEDRPTEPDDAGRVDDALRTPDVVLPVRTEEDAVPRDDDGLATLTTPEFRVPVLTAPLLRADADDRAADVLRDAAGRELRATLLTALPREAVCRADAELRTADEFRVDGFAAYLVDIPPLLLSLEPKCTGSPRCP